MMTEFCFLISAYGSFVSANNQVRNGYATELPKNIYILAGQCNMAGRGGVIDGIWDGIIPSECKPNPFILRLGMRQKSSCTKILMSYLLLKFTKFCYQGRDHIKLVSTFVLFYFYSAIFCNSNIS